MDNVELSSGADGGGLNPYQKLLSIRLLIPFAFENRVVRIRLVSVQVFTAVAQRETRNSLDKSNSVLCLHLSVLTETHLIRLSSVVESSICYTKKESMDHKHDTGSQC